MPATSAKSQLLATLRRQNKQAARQFRLLPDACFAYDPSENTDTHGYMQQKAKQLQSVYAALIGTPVLHSEAAVRTLSPLQKFADTLNAFSPDDIPSEDELVQRQLAQGRWPGDRAVSAGRQPCRAGRGCGRFCRHDGASLGPGVAEVS